MSHGQSAQGEPIVEDFQQAAAQLRRHQAILKAVSTSAVMLLRAPAPEPKLLDVLQLVASAAGASRAYLFKMETTDTGPALATNLYRWEAPGFAIPPTRAHVEHENMSAVGIASWIPRLAAGEIIAGNVHDFGEAERSFLTAQGVLAVLIIPILVDGRWWGQMGLDDCETEREWTPSEIDTFKTLAEIIGASLAEREHLADLSLLAAIVESSRDAIIGQTLDGTVSSWNHGAESIYGYRADEMIGQSVRRLIPEERLEKIDRNRANRVDCGQAAPFDTEGMRKDGTRIPLSMTISSIRDVAENVTGTSVIARDITQQMRAAEELAYRDRLLHAVTVGTAVLVDAERFEQGILEALRTVGETMHADRVTVIQSFPGQVPPAALRYVWQIPDIRVRLDPAVFAALPMAAETIAVWLTPLHERKAVIVQLATSEEPIRGMFEIMQNKSMLMMPIFAGDKLWGIVGIDACTTEREWTMNEIHTLETLADVIGALVLHNEELLLLEKSEERFRVVSATAQDAIIMIDAAGRIGYWNQAAERILGYSAEDAAGKAVHEFLAPARFREDAAQGMKAFVATGQGPVIGKTLELTALRKDGAEIDIELSLASVQLGGEWQAVGMMRDITARKQAEQQIVEMARSDSLTGLANRRAFVSALQYEIARARREESCFAVFYLDLDRFKDVNDTLGHPVGDLLLQAVAQRLRAGVRESDTVARFGGDEFAVIGVNIREPADAGLLALKLLQGLSAPFRIEGNEIRCGTSVGIAIYGPEASKAETLLSFADLALYRAKSEGRGTYRFFTEAMDDDVRTRVALGAELRTAIESGQLFLLYQPQVNIKTRRITGIEALVRWNHPQRGVIGPDDFVAVAEQIGVIVTLGNWVMREACRQIRAWLDAGLDPCMVAVNVSTSQFSALGELERDIAAILAEATLAPNMIEIELTESVLMEASHEHNEVLMGLRQSGLRLALDDFGTGYSSLGYLRQFPVDRIKIAQCFVMDLEAGADAVAIVKAAISLALALGLDVIAEGVETEAQLELLKAWGCQEAQGFYFARPLPPEAITELLRGDRILPRSQPSATASDSRPKR